MSGARPDAWMPFYWGDYLRDTMHLRAEGHGAYMLLIGAYWCTGAPLPDDDDYLGGVTKLDPKAWRRLRPTLAKFFHIDGEGWHHKRIDHELGRSKNISASRQEAGRNGGKAKATALANEKQNPTQSQSPSQKDSDPDGSGADAPPIDPKAEIFGQGLIWLGQRTRRAESSLRSWLGQCCGRYGDHSTLAALIEIQAISPPVVDPISRMKTILEGRGHGPGSRQPEFRNGFAEILNDAERASEAGGQPVPIIDG